MDLKKYFTDADINEIAAIVKDLKSLELRETAIRTLLSGEADSFDNKGVYRKDGDNIAAKSWVIAVLLQLKYKGYEVKKRDSHKEKA